MRVLREHFRPEFLNRVDDMVIFRPLGEEQMSADSRSAAERGLRSCWKTGRSRWS